MESPFLVILPHITLLITALLLVLVRLVKPANRNYWLVASSGVFIALAIMLYSAPYWNFNGAILQWQYGEGTSFKFEVLFDNIAWLYSIAVIALLLVSVITLAARPSDHDRSSSDWINILSRIAVTIGSLIAISGGNLLILLFLLAFIDFLQVIFRIFSPNPPFEPIGLLQVSILIRIISLILVFWAVVSASTESQTLAFSKLSSLQISLLILSAVLRLGVLPPSVLFVEKQKESGPHTGFSHLIALAPVLILISRLTQSGVTLSNLIFGMSILGLSALVAAIRWLSADDDNIRLFAWINTLGAFILAAALRPIEQASLSWGLVLLLCGGVFVLTDLRAKSMRIFLWLAALFLTGLPLTPAWGGIEMYIPIEGYWGLFIIAQSFCVAGFLIPQKNSLGEDMVSERWSLLLSFLGAAVLLLALAGLTVVPSIAARIAFQALNLNHLVPGIAVTAISITIILVYRNKTSLLARINSAFDRSFHGRWFYRYSMLVFVPVKLVNTTINLLLESPSGIVWSFLLVVLLLSLFIQFGAGG